MTVAAAQENKASGILTLVSILVLISSIVLTISFSPAVAAYLIVFAIAVLMFEIAFFKGARSFRLVSAILPVAYLVTMVAPFNEGLPRTLLLYGVIGLLSTTYYFTLRKRAPSQKSTVKTMLLIAAVSATGIMLGSLGYYFFGVEPIIDKSESWALIGLLVTMGAIEAIYFHGLLQNTASSVSRPAFAALFIAILYAVATADFNSPHSIIFSCATGSVLALTYYLRPSIVSVTILNISTKLTVGLLAINFA